MSFLVVIVALTVVVNIISDRICAYSVVGGVVLDGVTAGDGIRWYNVVVIALTTAVTLLVMLSVLTTLAVESSS